MLKISMIESTAELVKIRIDGQITGRWVELMQGMCEVQLKKGLRVSLDLRNVSFVDRDGITVLRSLANRQVKFLNALPFIAEQIRETAP
jgi:anti-anti-sigma regulatory factor